MFYKEREFRKIPIGYIPQDWEKAKLSELSEPITKGTTPTSFGFRYTSSGVNFIKVESIGKHGAFLLEKIPHISEDANRAFRRSILKENDILFSIAGALGRVTLVTKKILPANTNQALAIIRIREKNKLLVEYLKYFLMAPQIQNFVTSITIQSQQANINLKHVRDFWIALPPLVEQQQIVRVLSIVDLAVQKTDEVIAKTERLKKGLMQELLTKGIGHKEFRYSKELGNAIPQEWQVGKLEQYAYIKGRIGWRGLKASEYTEKGPYLVANKHIINNKIAWEICDHLSEFRYEESPEIQLKVNDVIISKDGTIGEAAIVEHLPDKTTINSTMMLVRVTSESVVPRFMFCLFQGPSFRRFMGQKVSGTSIPHLFQRDMKNLNIPLPPLQEQQQIVNILSTVDKKSEVEKKEKGKLERIKQGLMDLFLTGKVRVKVN